MNSFQPSIIQALRNAFLAAQLGDAVPVVQPIERNSDLVLGRKRCRVGRRMSFTTHSAGAFVDEVSGSVGASSSLLRHYHEVPTLPPPKKKGSLRSVQD